MRPLPSEVIAGVRRILKETIEPELTSAHARARIGEVRAVLAQVDWDDAAFALAARTHDLARVLGRISEWRVADPVRRAAFPPVTVVAAEEETLAAHQAAYERLAAAAAAVVEPLATWVTEHPDDERARELRAELVTAL